MKEPQIGIEPMTARCGNGANGAAPSAADDLSVGEMSQGAPEARPNLRENGNEVAIEVVPWTRMKDGTRRHEYLIDQMVAMGWQRRGLREELRRRAKEEMQSFAPLGEEDAPWELDDADWGYLSSYAVGRLPDAWRIVEEGPEEGWACPVTVVELLEVIVSHGLTPEKQLDYARLWMAGDCCENIAVRIWGMDVRGYMAPLYATFADYAETMRCRHDLLEAAA